MSQYIDDNLPLPPFSEILRIIEIRDNSNKTMKSSDATEGEETRGRWTPEEHRLFLEGVMLYGKDWKKMQPLIRTRSLVQIRTHAQKVFKKVAIKRNPDDATIKLDDDDLDDDDLDGDLGTAIASSSSSSSNRLSKVVRDIEPLGFSHILTRPILSTGSSSSRTATLAAAPVTAPITGQKSTTETSISVPVSADTSVPSAESDNCMDPPHKRSKR